MKQKILFFIILVALFQNSSVRGQAMDEYRFRELTDYLNDRQRTPEEYVLEKFRDHDVVLLGEQHRLKQNVELIARLIPVLHDNGICVLATEFARREEQPLLDSLVQAEEWNEDLGRLILFRMNVFWGYREYLDIYKAAWQTNRKLAAGYKPFRIIGMNDSPDWSFIKTEADRSNDEALTRVWKDCDEKYWAEAVIAAVNAGEKVLWYSGIHHAFTKYHQPVIQDTMFILYNTTRAGNHLWEALGDRVMTVFLHAPWNSYAGYGGNPVLPADGIIDSLLESLGPTTYPVGFDLAGTPYGQLTGKTSVYCHGYPDFTLQTFCDGWIYHCPISEYTGVTAIPDFVNESNIEIARTQAPNCRFRNAAAAEFNRAVAVDGAQEWLIEPFRK